MVARRSPFLLLLGIFLGGCRGASPPTAAPPDARCAAIVGRHFESDPIPNGLWMPTGSVTTTFRLSFLQTTVVNTTGDVISTTDYVCANGQLTLPTMVDGGSVGQYDPTTQQVEWLGIPYHARP